MLVYLLSILVSFFKFGWGTTDNATNNDTCLKALAKNINSNSLCWDPIEHSVQCAT